MIPLGPACARQGEAGTNQAASSAAAAAGERPERELQGLAQSRSPTVTLLRMPRPLAGLWGTGSNLGPGETPSSIPACVAAAFSARARRRRLERRERLEGVLASGPVSKASASSSSRMSEVSSAPYSSASASVSSAHRKGVERCRDNEDSWLPRGVRLPVEEETSDSVGSEKGVTVEEAVRQGDFVKPWQRPSHAAEDLPSAREGWWAPPLANASAASSTATAVVIASELQEDSTSSRQTVLHPGAASSVMA